MQLRRYEAQHRPALDLDYLSSPEGLELLAKMTALGLTWSQMASRLGCKPASLIEYVKTHKECSDKVNEALRLVASVNVEGALYKRATGYDYTEETYEMKGFDEYGQPIYLKTKEVVKHMPPDVNAAKTWLKTMEPDMWKDDAQIQVNNVYLDAEDKLLAARQRIDEVLGISTDSVKQP